MPRFVRPRHLQHPAKNKGAWHKESAWSQWPEFVSIVVIIIRKAGRDRVSYRNALCLVYNETMAAGIRVPGIAACGYFYFGGTDSIAHRPGHHKLQDRKGHACEPGEFVAAGVGVEIEIEMGGGVEGSVFHRRDKR